MIQSHRRPAAFVLSLVLSGACWSAAASVPVPQSPQSVVEELLAADRAAAAASARTTVIPGLTAMFASDVMMGAPVVGFARGIDAATEALKSNPDNVTGRLEWAPVRGGISADGQQGFTFGYMTLHGAKGAVPLKYLAYWVKRDGRWQVAAYRRRPRATGEVSTALLAPAVPSQLVPVTTDPATLARHSASLTAAEQAFSDEAQRIGLGAAFTKHGSADAMNMGGPNDAGFVLGNDKIGRNIGADGPTDSSPVSWSADSVIVASSGDLGITFGLIRSNAKPPAQPPIPFFTIWRRANPSAPWRYVAE
jgi:ketosteroid isomerase-like protein